jgi:peptidyl-tRNA hydrolase
MLKEYIAVLDEVPDHMVPVLIAHAVLGAHLQWNWLPDRSSPECYEDWLEDSFRKVVLRVNRKEFEKMRVLPNVYEAHENTTLGGEKRCLVICPREEYPNVVKFAKMWKPKESNG